MNYWNKIPLFRLLIPLLFGILTAIHSEFSKDIFFCTTLVLFIFILGLIYFNRGVSIYKNRWIFGLLIYLFVFAVGVNLTQFHAPGKQKDHYTQVSSGFCIVVLNEDVVSKEKSYKCEVEVIAVKSEDRWINTEGKAILYLAKDSFSSTLMYADKLAIKGSWKVIPAPTNPAQFDYKNYLFNNGITAQQYVQQENWDFISSAENFSIRKYAFLYQKKLLNILTSNFEGEELAVISALLLGYKDLLNRETIMTYSSSGAMHILAVSGLHVGIIFFVLNSLFFFLEKIKYGNYIKAIFLIVSLWAYALLTGLSPSVLRAATMFSFIIIGSALKRETNIYNTLAASAFVLLMYDPFIIMKVGFQLSYAAVLGIVYLQPKLYNLFRPSNWLLDKIWAITTVSIAAQLATFPLGMYYFHQFPNYFLLSNLFVIPLATFIINGGILLFMISSISGISTFIAWTVNKLLIFLNLSVAWVKALPHSLSLGININTLETLLIYSVVLLLITAFIKKKATHLQLGFFVFILFMGFQVKEQYDTKQQSYFIVYDVPKQRAIDFVDGNNNYFLATADLRNNQNKMRFHITHYRWERRVQQSTLIPDFFQEDNYFRNGNCIQFFDQKILLCDEYFIKSDNSSTMEFDYIIVSEKAKLDFTNINCKQVIIDSSVSKYKWEQIKKECLKWDIPFYHVSTQGAYLFEITS